MLREWINFLTDVEQFHRTTDLSLKIMSFPTTDAAALKFDRSTGNILIAKFAVIAWILMHFISALIIAVGLIQLIKNINQPSAVYHNKKELCLFGLAFALFSYFTLTGFLAMDVFLSWMQNLNFNAELAGYGLPLIVALLYLNMGE